jgi:putative ABC transport system substrate-binding protein
MGELTRRAVTIALVGAAAGVRSAGARDPGRPARIGLLTAQRPAAIAPYLPILRAGLADEGFVEGRNLTIEYRYGEDSRERTRDLARELADLPVDLVVTQGSAVGLIAQMNLAVPIVFVISSDPIASGFAESLSRPIGNKTGLTFMAFEFASKRLEMLRELMPAIERVTVLGNPEHLGTESERAFAEATGRRSGLDVGFCGMSVPSDIDAACARMVRDRAQAIALLTDSFAVQNREVLLDFARGQNLPVVSGWPVFAESGALFTYGPRLSASYRRLAYYVGRILRGTRATDLPIERPSVFHTVVNLSTARRLGIEVPRAFLARADEVIE